MSNADFDKAIREALTFRARRDEPARGCIAMADYVVPHITAEFGQEAHETVGLALLVAAKFATELIMLDIDNPTVIANVLGLAGQRIVTDARAVDAALRDGAS